MITDRASFRYVAVLQSDLQQRCREVHQDVDQEYRQDYERPVQSQDCSYDCNDCGRGKEDPSHCVESL